MKNLTFIGAMLLAGCASPGRFQDRIEISQGLPPNLTDYGAESSIDPIDAALVQAQNETRLLQAYAIRAGVIHGPDQRLPDNDSADWYLIAEAGMNDIQQKCETYTDAIFQLRRDFNTSKDQITLVGATTATLLGVFGAAADAIAAAAAGFGFAAQGVGNVAENILFTVEPSGIRKLIGRSQSTYRAQIERDMKFYDNRPATVRAIQGYLSLCLPSTIEMQINESVSLTDFGIRQGSGEGSVFDIERVPSAERLPEPTAGATGGVTPRGVGARPADAGPTPSQFGPQPAGCRTPDECKTPGSQVIALQAALCIPEADRANAFGPQTRSALSELRGWIPDTIVARGGGDSFASREIRNLVGKGACPPATFANALERFYLGDRNANFSIVDAQKVDRLARLLGRRGHAPSAPPQGALTPALRQAITAFQNARNIEATGFLDAATLGELSEES